MFNYFAGTFAGFFVYLFILASNLMMLMLLIRYFMAPYLWAESGLFLQEINRIAMNLSSPFRRVTYFLGFKRRDVSPWAAILVILMIRGLLFSLLGTYLNPGVADWKIWLVGQQDSFHMGARSLLGLTGLLLFVSVLFARAGGFYSGAFVRTIDNVAATLFGHVKKVVRLKNLWGLLAVSFLYLGLIFGILSCLIRWSLLILHFWAFGVLSLLWWVAVFYMLLCLIFIALQWLSAFGMHGDESNRGRLFLQAMVMPALMRCRQWFPWARIGILDLSPLFLFLGLSLSLGLINMGRFVIAHQFNIESLVWKYML